MRVSVTQHIIKNGVKKVIQYNRRRYDSTGTVSVSHAAAVSSGFQCRQFLKKKLYITICSPRVKHV
jgi:hypothetical protein